MEAKISQDAPDSSLQVRALFGQAKSLCGHLAVWKCCLATSSCYSQRRYQSKTTHKDTWQQSCTAHVSSEQHRKELKLKSHAGQVSWQHLLSRDVILVTLLFEPTPPNTSRAYINNNNNKKKALLLEGLFATSKSFFFFSCCRLRRLVRLLPFPSRE